jgi:hypothetical protein
MSSFDCLCGSGRQRGTTGRGHTFRRGFILAIVTSLLLMSAAWAEQYRCGGTLRATWGAGVTGMASHILSGAGTDEAFLQAGYDVQARRAPSGSWRTRDCMGMARPCSCQATPTSTNRVDETRGQSAPRRSGECPLDHGQPGILCRPVPGGAFASQREGYRLLRPSAPGSQGLWPQYRRTMLLAVVKAPLTAHLAHVR